MTPDLALVFTVLMGLAILAYVVLDGYDLGVGMLMPAATEREQDSMVARSGHSGTPMKPGSRSASGYCWSAFRRHTA